jgi:phosphoenolpyruvate synthase/pyruvate phosphate dikinase
MKENYRLIGALKADPQRQQQMARVFLKRLRDWIQTAPPEPEFRNEMRRMLDETFGKDGTYGVFVRSDTNVEDLPGFTGAGLNLTVPNVVGFENILAAVREVWASPFTERAYGWRQAHMEQPEYVFPAVLVQLGFPAEKSGVMVTCDVDTGDLGWLSVAVNEGVGGAVEGQAAESLRIRIDTGAVEFLAQATAPRRAVLLPRGGVERLPASGTDAVLQPDEITRLISFAKEVPMRFPELRTKDGQPIPADVEFGFRGGELALLQIRPFVENRNARRNEYLRKLDEGLRARGNERVRLDGVTSGYVK